VTAWAGLTVLRIGRNRFNLFEWSWMVGHGWFNVSDNFFVANIMAKTSNS
jgi:hypothetical protein